MKSNIATLIPDNYYHVYNRGIDGCTILREDKHYRIFIEKYAHYLLSFIDTYAYCLLGNHFHFLIRIKSEDEIRRAVKIKYPTKSIDDMSLFLSRQFAHLFNGYAQFFNSEVRRTGALFEKPFRRVLVDSDVYFSRLVSYIHQNPEQHGIITDFRKYTYSSYQSHLAKAQTKLKRKEVIDWFGGKEGYVEFHKEIKIERDLNKYLIDL